MVASMGLITLVSLLIGIIYLFFIRSFDIYEKDPWLKLFLSFIAGGVLSIFFVSVIYQFFEVEHTMAHAIIRIGLPEEFAKLAAFFVIFLIFGKDINEPVDGILYMSSIALGFACIESISYAHNSETPYLILITRAFVSVLGHITFTGYMGIALYIHLKVRRNYTGLLFSLTLASLAHGLYDGLLFNPQLTFIFKYLFVAGVIFHFYLIRIALNFSGFRQRFSPDLFAEDDCSGLIRCMACNTYSKNKQLSFWKIHPYRCSHCGNMIFTSHSFKMLMRYFRPVLRSGRYRQKLARDTGDSGLSLIEGNRELIYSRVHQIFSMKPEALGDWIRSSYIADRNKAMRLPVSGFILRYLGLRYLEK